MNKAILERLIEAAPLIDAVDSDVAEINKAYALVIVGGTAAIMKFREDGKFDLLKPGSFSQWFSNKVVFKTNSDGESVATPLAKYWLHHEQRRQYEGIVFKPKKEMPGYYNLWKGFTVEPKPGDWSLFKEHLQQNVFGEYFDWGSAGSRRWYNSRKRNPERRSCCVVLSAKRKSRS